MSAPNLVLREADQLRYGVLSIKAANALRSVLANQPLTTEERQVLRQAAEFLTIVADGTRIATGATFRAGAHPSQSMAVLDFAEIPIDLLRVRGDRAAFFTTLASALSSASENRRLGPQRRQAAQQAMRYFDFLHRALQRQRELRRHIGNSARSRAAA